MTIQEFASIAALHTATGYGQHGGDLPDFDIFPVETTYPATRTVMPPYRLNAYQVVLLEQSADARLHINTEPVGDPSDTLTFASPSHVLTWQRGAAQRGYVALFASSFLEPLVAPLEVEFRFFSISAPNVVRLDASGRAAVRDCCERLYSLFVSAHPHRMAMLRLLLRLLLYECSRLAMQQEGAVARMPRAQAITWRFQQLVNQHFLTHRTVESYAALLGITPDYLRQVLKASAGRSAHSVIAERVLLEAKALLRYSDLAIATIADDLGFAEPTHFGRFFRRHTGLSPRDWRATRS
jgi:AraC family transcriptional regulator, transcriptional activator of pobA